MVRRMIPPLNTSNCYNSKNDLEIEKDQRNQKQQMLHPLQQMDNPRINKTQPSPKQRSRRRHNANASKTYQAQRNSSVNSAIPHYHLPYTTSITSQNIRTVISAINAKFKRNSHAETIMKTTTWKDYQKLLLIKSHSITQ